MDSQERFTVKLLLVSRGLEIPRDSAWGRDRTTEKGSGKGRPARLLACKARQARGATAWAPSQRAPSSLLASTPAVNQDTGSVGTGLSTRALDREAFAGVVWKLTWHFDVFERIIHLLANRRDLVRISVTECDRKSKRIVASTARDLFSHSMGRRKKPAAGSAGQCGPEKLELPGPGHTPAR